LTKVNEIWDNLGIYYITVKDGSAYISKSRAKMAFDMRDTPHHMKYVYPAPFTSQLLNHKGL